MTKRAGTAIVLALALAAGGCAAGQAFHKGDLAMKAGDLDEAVAQYKKASQASPDNANYKITLERAQLAASRQHLERAKDFEQKDQLEAALGEYRQASEYDPSNRLAAAKVVELDRSIRDRIEASRPKPAFQQMRDRVRATQPEPTLLNFTTKLGPIRFVNASLRDILSFIANATGINVLYDREYTDRPATVQLEGVTLEQALNQILATNQLSYKVVNDRTILVFNDNAQKHAQYDEQVVRTFYISHADATELSQTLNTIIRVPGIAVQPSIVANKTANTITVRATTSIAQIIEKIIEQNDKPHAEIVVDVEILEVDRVRAKQYGLNLSEYAIGGIFSPEVSPSATTTTGGTTSPGTTTTPGTTPSTTPTTSTGTTTTASGRNTTPTGALSLSPPPINLNTLSQGVTTADFYMAVPSMIVRFLETDTRTKLVAKPQLRGAEGTKLTLNLGDEIPVISTSYTPIAGGGAAVNPLSSYQYRPVGINIDMTPWVTLDGDIRLELTVESSSRQADVNIGGQNIPSFGTRKITTKLRLRDGESNLLAGLLREDERKSLTGFPGAIHVPVLKQLFSANDNQVQTTDIVMLLTPHVVRTHEITESDLRPIYIGSQGNMNLGGPPPLIAPPQGAEEVGPAGGAAATTPGVTGTATPPATSPARVAPAIPPGQTAPVGVEPPAPPGAVGAPGAPSTPSTAIIAPPGTSPVPGTVAVPQTPPPQTPAVTSPNPNPPVTISEPPPAAATGTGAAGTGAAATPPATGTPPPATTTPAPAEATSSAGIGQAQIVVTPPGTTFRVGGGPYTVPISISNATRLSTITLTLLYNPNVLRVRAVQEGSFMRSGGVQATFNQQIAPGRVDITIARAADSLGATGTGLLSAVLFDAIAPGSATITVSGAATGPGGTAMGLQFRPVTVNVQQ